MSPVVVDEAEKHPQEYLLISRSLYHQSGCSAALSKEISSEFCAQLRKGE